MTIRNPILWGYDLVRPLKGETLARASGRMAVGGVAAEAPPTIHRITLNDLREALRLGAVDFAAGRTDVIMLCLIYPVIGLLLGRLGLGHDVLPLLFPLAAGFALVGPLAAVGLNEMSRQRERGIAVTWRTAFDVLRAPSLGAIVGMGLLLTAVFLAWLVAASLIWRATLGSVEPASAGAFFTEIFTTGPGWALISFGVAIGFVFAVAVLSITVVTFPLLLDRRLRLRTAIGTSLRAVAANPTAMAAWGAIVAFTLILGSIPFLIGLAIVLPVLGHATWHLYRRVVS